MGVPLTKERMSKGECYMQERPDRKRSAPSTLAGLNGTGKHRAVSQGTGKYKAISTSTGEYRAIPQRPPGMPHVDEKPERRRVPRPEYLGKPPRRMRPRLIILAAIAASIVIFAIVIVSLLFSAINQSAGPTLTAVDFVNSLSTQNYDNAYQDLGPAVTIRINRQEFTKNATDADQQSGKVTDYAEDSVTEQDNTKSITYRITRKNTSYKLTLILQKDPNDNNNWKIVDYGTHCYATGCYGTTLGPK